MQLDFLTPPSNTGLNSQIPARTSFRPSNPDSTFVDRSPNYGIDNLTLMWDECECDVLSILRDCLLLEFDLSQSFSMRVGVMWDTCFRTVRGDLYQQRVIDNEGNKRYRLAISGKTCSALSANSLIRFCEIIKSQIPSVVCSRIDVRLDDFSRRLTKETICAALDSGNYSGFKKYQLISNGGGAIGWTINLGSRQSNSFTRIYDKGAESLGRIMSIRFETEYKDEKANAIFNHISDCVTPSLALKYIHGLALGKVNFIERSDKNLERCSMLTWWAEFLAYVDYQVCQVIVEKCESSIEKSKKWIEKQVEKTLALLHRTFGEEGFKQYLDGCITSGARRLKRIDELKMVEYMQATLAC